jgi:hypothetical protein
MNALRRNVLPLILAALPIFVLLPGGGFQAGRFCGAEKRGGAFAGHFFPRADSFFRLDRLDKIQHPWRRPRTFWQLLGG